MMTELELYRLERRLLSHPANFTRKASARDSQGHVVHPTSRLACRWCISGASQVVCPASLRPPATTLQTACQLLFRTFDPVAVNDFYGHAAILAALDLAISRLTPPKTRRYLRAA